MQVSANGWGRNMGEIALGSIDLWEKPLNRDERRWMNYGASELYWSARGPEVHWCQKVKMTGDYRIRIKFSNLDVIRLLRASYGTQLDVDLIEKYGFTVSPELEKAILKKVKLTNLTLGDLVAMSKTDQEEPATADALVSGDNVTPFKRRG